MTLKYYPHFTKNKMIYKREPLEDDEIVLLKQACKTFEESVVINVLLETGMRVSELGKLTRDQISWQRDCITTVGKGGKRRVIPMSSKTRFYLSEYFKDKTRIKFGDRWIQKIVKNVAERAKIMKKVSPHVLRHTFAVCYLHKGGNIRALQGILGHSHIQTTDVYLNYSGIRVIDDFKRVWE
jgi:integrase/recombinase XerD